MGLKVKLQFKRFSEVLYDVGAQGIVDKCGGTVDVTLLSQLQDTGMDRVLQVGCEASVGVLKLFLFHLGRELHGGKDRFRVSLMG